MAALILYDVLSKLKPPQWSSNCLRTRIALNYLRIPYQTVWLSYPDIAPTLSKLGLPPSNPPPYDKRPAYTLPVIKHGDKYITGTFPIAVYLAEAFPPSGTRPSLFPHNSMPLAHLVQEHLGFVLAHARKVVLSRVPSWLDDRGADYFRLTRAQWLGAPLEEYYSDPKEREEIWGRVKGEFGRLAELYRHNGGPFILGTDASYADFQIVAVLFWIRRGDESQWENIMAIPELKAVWQACEAYLV